MTKLTGVGRGRKEGSKNKQKIDSRQSRLSFGATGTSSEAAVSSNAEITSQENENATGSHVEQPSEDFGNLATSSSIIFNNSEQEPSLSQVRYT